MIDLAPDIVDVWESPLDIPEEHVTQLYDTLSLGEQTRAKAFVDARGYRQYVISRGRMRQVLSLYTDVPAPDIHFTVVGDGKPALMDQGPRKIFFNNTHSGGLGLIAVTSGREVGIDMERVRDIERALQVSKRFFTPDEHAELAALPADEMIRAFLSIWCRREAGTKARGASVWRGLGSWNGPSRMARRPGIQADDSTEFTTSMLDLGADYIGAVVAAGSGWEVKMKGQVW
ncbi:MAG TPA: 4'-phosphopantetheinyl transferase superfamily protein [Gemmatimonadaceae bacterium]|nr:4'-phosphopantetheinyl transferase superfamily protein [Gemmatimonadaceae bacterium]